MNDNNQLKEEPEEETKEDDDDLEEGELKDDDDDDDDDDEDDNDDEEDDNFSHNNNNSNINNNPDNNSSNNNNNHSYPQMDEPPLPMNHVPMGPGAPMFPRGGPGGVGPMNRVNIRCRFYSKTSNKCTWGDHCRFEHRDESPGPDFDGHLPPPPLGGPPMVAGRGGPPPPMGVGRGGPPPPMGAVRGGPLPPMGAGRGGPPPPMSAADQPYPPYCGGGGNRHQPYPNYPSPSAIAYERRHRLAYELAPWNERGGGYGPPPVAPNKYDRAEPGGYPPRGFYGNPYGGGGGGREPPPYGREPMPHPDHGGGGGGGGGSREPPPYGREPMPPHPGHVGGGGGMYPHGYSVYPSAYRGGPPMGGPHVSHYKYMSSSQRLVQPDTRRSQSTKRGHDEDESSWSDSGSEDSILGQATYGNKNHQSKISKQQQASTDNNTTSDEPLEQGSGTPPGEPLPEDRERQEMLLNKLKEIEDLMAKKRGEQEDPM